MGLPASGSIMSATFVELVEACTVMCPHYRSRFGIAKYYRYEDDIFIVVEDREQFRGFWADFTSRALPTFQLDIEGWSRSSMVFLDAKISLDVRDGLIVFVTEPAFKSTGLNRPLSSYSVTPPGAKHWPLAELGRLYKLANGNVHIFARASFTFFRRFVKFNEHPRLLAAILNRRRAIIRGLHNTHVNRIVEPAQVFPPRWFVLPFHPGLSNHLTTVVRKAQNSPILRAALPWIRSCGDQEVRIGLSWSNSTRSMAERILSISKHVENVN